MALGPTSRALQDQGSETRAAVATSIRRALQPYQRDKQVALAGAIWLVTANNAWLSDTRKTDAQSAKIGSSQFPN